MPKDLWANTTHKKFSLNAIESIYDFYKASNNMPSLNQSLLTEDDNNTSLEEMIGEDFDFLSQPLQEEIQEKVNSLVVLIPEPEWSVFQRHYGICNCEQMSLAEIANELNLSKQKVKQLDEKAFRRFRYLALSNHLYDYIQN